MEKKRHLDGTGKGEFIYDYKYDTLMFKIKERDYKMSIELQNFVLDIDKERFITGIRIFDASKVFGINKYILKNIVQGEFKTSVDNNIITVTLKFVGKRRNKIIPMITEKENFTQQITKQIDPKYNLADSDVTYSIEA